jgi:hypothetical protein
MKCAIFWAIFSRIHLVTLPASKKTANHVEVKVTNDNYMTVDRGRFVSHCAVKDLRLAKVMHV